MTTTQWWCPQGERSGGLFDRAYAKRDVIKTADLVIDLAPEGGVKRGEIVAVGVPEAVAEVPESFTGHYLKPLFRQQRGGRTCAERNRSIGTGAVEGPANVGLTGERGEDAAGG